MKVFISSLNVPIGYTPPSFPLLYWPLGKTSSQYSTALLYYSQDVWRFTTLWFLIMFLGLYSVAALIAICNHFISSRRIKVEAKSYTFTTLFIIGSYLFTGCFIGFVSGSVIGLIILAIYKAGSMTMSTWIPFTWSLVGILYDICSSYLLSLMTL